MENKVVVVKSDLVSECIEYPNYKNNFDDLYDSLQYIYTENKQ